jgi:hypothetical protein
MATRQDLNITISKDGKVEIKVSGVEGPRCLEITKDLEEALGIVTNREKTSDFYKDQTSEDISINGQSR